DMSATQPVTATTLTLTIDGREVSVPPGTTIWQAARQAGIEIPVLCHDPKLKPVGVCRMCVVDVGERVLAASCVRECAAGMTASTSSLKVEQHRRMLTQLLLSEYPPPSDRQPAAYPCELESLGRRFGLLDDQGKRTAAWSLAAVQADAATVSMTPVTAEAPTETSTTGERLDLSSPVIAVDHDACILCDRCIRACDDLQNNHVIGRTGKGHTARIAFDLNNPMGQSSCVSCGECAAACPTDALTHKAITLPIVLDEQTTTTSTVCPYCGVGCSLSVHTRDDQIILAEGRSSPVNHERLCVKGRYGWDYALHPQRLRQPLIRRDNHYPKGPLSVEVQGSLPNRRQRRPGGIVDYAEVLPAFREATWDEALELVGRRLQEIKKQHGPRALAGFGSAKCSNEEAYLFQKLMRAGLGTNNVDHCTRLCHASSVAALMETIGSGAVTNVFADVEQADVCLITGSNTTANHPVAATFIKAAVRQGTKLIVVDVRRHDLASFATHYAQIKAGSDVSFYNAVMHVLIAEDRIDHEFIAARTENFEALRELVLREFSPEQAAPLCGIPADEIRAIARTIGGEPNAGKGRRPAMLVFWGMGISQHTHGTDNARCLISLCLLTGNVGKPGTGLHPLRGQNNVQGASDAGLIPMVYPDYQPVSDPIIRNKFEAAWGVSLDPQPGLTVVEIMRGAIEHSIRSLYVLGENPFLSDPNINKVRKALSTLDFLVVQDIFLTETAEFADVILPATSYFEKDGTYTNTDRRVQLGRRVLPSPGAARQDWQLICEIGKRIGLPMEYASPAEVFDEFAGLTQNYRGLSHANLGLHGKLWPCPDPEQGDGEQILFGDRFPTASGRGRFVPCACRPPAEIPDHEYPFVLTTGRVLEHWHTGSMTRRSHALSTIVPNAHARLHPVDLQQLGIADRALIRVSSRRGTIELQAIADAGIERGCLFIPFHFREASANILTNDALDPSGKIPEFKYCAVKVAPANAAGPV
ncbi:MAG: formate dehydrogenase subunit alpha, partial [Planctomycetaceae bacterium]